mgnify:CR=1 FL=1
MSLRLISNNSTSIAAVNAGNLAFADKTMFIERLESDPDCRAALFLRPGRFGKTLFTDILLNYYDRAMKESFDETFRGTYVHEHRTPQAGSLCCIRLDFSQVSGCTEQAKSSFTRELADALRDFTGRYPELGLPYSELKSGIYDEPAGLMKEFVTNFRSRSSGKERLFVIIDRYDHFANSILARNAGASKETASAAECPPGFIRQFYAFLKEAFGGVRGRPISRIFITGVSSVSLDSLISGFNIAANISNDPRFNAMAGLTREELSEIIDGTVDFSELNGLTKERILQVMESRYGGYAFSFQACERIFNPDLCLSFLKDLTSAKAMPERLLPDSAGADPGRLEAILRLAAPEAGEEITRRIQRREEIPADPPVALSISQRGFLNYSQAVSLLMYHGYLTIAPQNERGSNKVMYRCPNEACYQVFNRYTESRSGRDEIRRTDL